MKLSQFKFKLPEEKIAKYPAPYRDECRMMVLHRKTGEIEHRMFKDILEYFDEKDVFVFNDTKVFPARLYGNKEKTGARIEVFLLRELNQELRLWDVLVDPARKIRIGNKLYFGEDNSIVAEVIDNTTSRGRTLRFLYDGDHDEFKRSLYALGEAPVPRFVGRESEPEDLERFQCIFAKHEGAVTAPTAGLHFTKELLAEIEAKGVKIVPVMLHVGLGTFRPVKEDKITDHIMHSEFITVTPEAANTINERRRAGGRTIAVGTTSLRTLESASTEDGLVHPISADTGIFIYPGYKFKAIDALITNFHLPESTLLMLVSALCGRDTVMNAYETAVKEKYRFFSFGDAMLIL